MTDRLQQKAEEIVREVCGTASAKYWQDQSVAHKCALAGLTAGIALAAERCEERAQRSNNARGGMGQIFADTQDREARECAVAIRALAKGETQEGRVGHCDDL